jgi:hypothetical protein
MHYKTIEANVRPAGVPMHIRNAVYSAELNKDKAPLTAVLFEQLDSTSIPTLKDELRYVLKTTNGRVSNDTMLHFEEQGAKTLLLLACSRDHVEEIFDHYFASASSQGVSLAAFMHEYVPTPLKPEECKDRRCFMASRADRFYNELTQGLEETKARALRYVGGTLDKLVSGELQELIRG